MRRVIPFRPPALLPSDDLGWVLCRAFGSPEAQALAPSPRDVSEVLSLSAALGLGPSIAHRTPASMLQADLGPEGSAALGRALLVQAAHGLTLRQTLARFCAAADARGKTVVLLKHAALEALGLATPSTRDAVDIDVLVRSSDIAELARVAGHAGFVPDARWPSSFHPLVLVSPGSDQVPVECHVMVPNVRTTDGPADATVDSLERADLLQPATGFPNSVRVPTAHVVAAHLLTHALVQHRFTPAYSATRLLLDGALLNLDAHPELADSALRWVAHCVEAEDVRDLVELLGMLRRGAPVAHINESAGPARLLAHVVHSATDRVYADSLLIARQRQRLAENGLGSWLAHHMVTAFMPKTSSAHLDYDAASRGRPARGVREPLRSATEFARGLTASAKLWMRRAKTR